MYIFPTIILNFRVCLFLVLLGTEAHGEGCCFCIDMMLTRDEHMQIEQGHKRV